MKILYLITKSEIGGAGAHVLDLCAGMKSAGHKPALMCPSGGWLDKEFLKDNNDFFSNDYFSNTANPFKIIKACFLVSQAIKNFNPDIIACHSSMAGILGRVMSLFYKKPKVVFTAHSWAFTEGAPFLRKILMIPVEKFLAKFTDKIICVSLFDKNIALKYKVAKDEKIKVIHNGVRNMECRNLQRKENFRIITVSRLDYPKLPELLIRAFALVVNTKPNSELFIIGYGARLDKIVSLIQELKLTDKIKIFNIQDKEKVISELIKADLFALISKHEGLPLAVLEAMSVGLPIVASKVGGIGEEVADDCGYLVENDAEKIKDAILKIISSESLPIFMSKNSWNRQRNIFSLNKFLQETEKVYKDLLIP